MILYSHHNPNGIFLDELMTQLSEELEVKTQNLSSEDTVINLSYRRNNAKIQSLFKQIKLIQEQSVAVSTALRELAVYRPIVGDEFRAVPNSAVKATPMTLEVACGLLSTIDLPDEISGHTHGYFVTNDTTDLHSSFWIPRSNFEAHYQKV